jgi:hypothetical protein
VTAEQFGHLQASEAGPMRRDAAAGGKYDNRKYKFAERVNC